VKTLEGKYKCRQMHSEWLAHIRDAYGAADV